MGSLTERFPFIDDRKGYRHPFVIGTHFYGGLGDVPRTGRQLVEMCMSRLSAEIRSKQDWWKQFKNKDIRSEWERNALHRTWTIRTPSGWREERLSANQIKYVLDELAGYALLRDEVNGCQVSCFERIWESESLLDTHSLRKLRAELRRFAESPEGQRTRTEDGITLNIVDPFLNSLVYYKTTLRYHELSGSIPLHPCPIRLSTISNQFAFLPTDVAVSSSGSARFLSYINNIHPGQKSLYQILETALTACVPLFEHVLTDLHRHNPLLQRITGSYRYEEWEEPDPPEHSDDEDGWVTHERELRHWMLHRPIRAPDIPATGYSGGLERRNHTVSLRGRKLQVVVQVSETRLNALDPECPGSSWHVEGMRNEQIVACCLYYPSVDNLTPHTIQFRMAVTAPRCRHPGDIGGCLRTWGFKDGDPCHQYLGTVEPRTGFCIAFPNIYQHRHTSFSLKDRTRSGHQTVIAFFLVDPDIGPMVSTSVVSPQQREWISDAVYESINPRLPNEIVEQIVEDVDGIMRFDEALGFRRQMKAERADFTERNNRDHFCVPFDVWN